MVVGKAGYCTCCGLQGGQGEAWAVRGQRSAKHLPTVRHLQSAVAAGRVATAHSQAVCHAMPTSARPYGKGRGKPPGASCSFVQHTPRNTYYEAYRRSA